MLQSQDPSRYPGVPASRRRRAHLRGVETFGRMGLVHGRVGKLLSGVVLACPHPSAAVICRKVWPPAFAVIAPQFLDPNTNYLYSSAVLLSTEKELAGTGIGYTS